MDQKVLKELEARLALCLEQVKDLNRLFAAERRSQTERRILLNTTLAKDPNHHSLPIADLSDPA